MPSQQLSLIIYNTNILTIVAPLTLECLNYESQERLSRSERQTDTATLDNQEVEVCRSLALLLYLSISVT
jgi:hypothetical protein